MSSIPGFDQIEKAREAQVLKERQASEGVICSTMISLMCPLALTISYTYVYSICDLYTGLQQAQQGQNVHVDVLRMEWRVTAHPAVASGQDKIRQRKAESKRSNPSVWERVTLTPKATVMFWDSLHSEYVRCWPLGPCFAGRGLFMTFRVQFHSSFAKSHSQFLDDQHPKFVRCGLASANPRFS